MARTKPFDEHAVEYDQWFDKNRFAYQSELEAIRTLLPQSQRAVEIGVGTGRFAGPLGIKFGVEPSPAMRELARTRGIRVVGGLAEHLPFEDESFDLALIVTTICFLDDVGQALAEARRILVCGGHVLIGFLDRETALGKAYEEHRAKSVFYQVADFRSSKEVFAGLVQASFSSLTSVQTIFAPSSHMRETSDVKPGCGEGLFVVVRAEKPGDEAKAPD